MTDNEIIKALESEIHLAEYVDSDYCSNVNLEIIKSALALIAHQQAEIEKWQKEFKRACAERDAHIVTTKFAKSEAVKEFAERLIELALQEGAYEYVSVYDIENLLKEMVSESNA